MTTAIDPGIETDVHQAQNDKCQVHWRESDGSLQFVCGAPVTHVVTTHNGANLRTMAHTTQTDGMCERCLNEILTLKCELCNNTPVVIAYSRIS